MIQHPPIPPDPNRTEEELLLLRTGASTAFEAIMDGNLPMAEQLFHDYAVRVPDDWNAYLALGEIQAARGHITDASQSWMTYVEHGGDFPVALDHIVRSVVAHDSALLRLEHPDPRELAARCLHVSPEWSDPLLHDISLQVAGELAQYRKKLKSRRKYYESCFKKIPPGSDLYLVILPFLSFIAGYPPHGAGLLWHHIRSSNHTCEILDFNLM
ncbi:MAG TPA: hypothetical protein PLB62_06915, partial [Candidatus Sumerlaeota bacterium]|nr:hypothetical protein [Candidatus Sumerlaeota bacterium]